MKTPSIEDVAKGDNAAVNSLVELLKRFDCFSSEAEVDPANLSEAIIKVQAFARLRRTGIYDEATAGLIARPHCWMPRSPYESRFVLHPNSWDHQALTYCFDRYSDKLSVVDTRATIAKAFEQWALYSPLTFTEIAPHLEADIRIRWARGDHGDRYPFDGDGSKNRSDDSGNVLAHAFFPPPPIPPNTLAGEIHFDDDEKWTPEELSAIALHEIGHALGIKHSSVSEAVMWKVFGKRDRLHADDIEAIRARYGARDGRWHNICDYSKAVQIVATSNGDLYRRDSDGKIWEHRNFLTWLLLDDNKDTVEIDASSFHLDQRHYDGQVWRWDGGEWIKIDIGDGNVQIASARDGSSLYQRHKNGQIWKYIPKPRGSMKWKWLDENTLTVQLAAGNHENAYILHSNGQIFHYNGINEGNWDRISDGSDTLKILAEGHNLYRLGTRGRVYRLDGSSWELIDQNRDNDEIAASNGSIYLRHSDGTVFWYTGKDMKWLNISSKGRKALQLAAGGERLYCLCEDGTIWQILEGYGD